jgi:hypothetical protein
MVTRFLTAGTVVALSAAAFGTRPVASVAAPESHAAVHSPLVKPIKLDRNTAQLKLVQVVFRCVVAVLLAAHTQKAVSTFYVAHSSGTETCCSHCASLGYSCHPAPAQRQCHPHSQEQRT